MTSAGRRWEWGKQNAILHCASCGKSFKRYLSEITKAQKHYCSTVCRLAAIGSSGNPNWKGGMIERQCKNCKKIFYRIQATVKSGDGIFCCRQCKAAWQKKYPSRQIKGRENNRKREARKRASIKLNGSHTRQEWLALLEKSGGCCVKCGTDKDICRDHIIPLSKGGSDLISNIQALCRGCNSRKWNRI